MAAVWNIGLKRAGEGAADPVRRLLQSLRIGIINMKAWVRVSALEVVRSS